MGQIWKISTPSVVDHSEPVINENPCSTNTGQELEPKYKLGPDTMLVEDAKMVVIFNGRGAICNIT